MAKFTMAGTRNLPTFKPNQAANMTQTIGEFFTMAKHIGAYDANNTGGSNVDSLSVTGSWGSLHNLRGATSHMIKSSEWGAAVYLSTSAYGAGLGNVQDNLSWPDANDTDADGDTSNPRYGGITGCGPSSTAYSLQDGTPLNKSTIESPTACSVSEPDTAYNKSRGMLASTTNDVYGIYDMSREITEILAGNLTTSSSQATEESQYMTNPAKPPYVNLFRTADGFTKGAAQGAQNGNPLSWPNAQYEYRWNNDVCTWATCGGFGVHETNKYQMLYNISKYACGTNYQCLAVCQISRGGQNI